MPLDGAHAPTVRLLCRGGAADGTRFELRDQAVLGRDPSCDVVFGSAAVSSRHARIAWDESQHGYVLEDLESLNGTELDGLPVESGERLGRLHVITLGGSVELVYQGPEIVAASLGAVASEPVTGAATDREGTLMEQSPLVLPGALADADRRADGEITRTDLLDDPAVLPAVLAALDSPPATGVGGSTGATPAPELPPRQWRLRVEGHEPAGGFALDPGQNRVGRLPELEVQIDGADVSRLHAILTLIGDELSVRDAGSRNGTWVDDRMVTGATPVPAGAALRFGGVEGRAEATPSATGAAAERDGAER